MFCHDPTHTLSSILQSERPAELTLPLQWHMSVMTSHITDNVSVCSTACPAQHNWPFFGIYREAVDFCHKRSVTRKMFPCYNVTMVNCKDCNWPFQRFNKWSYQLDYRLTGHHVVAALKGQRGYLHLTDCTKGGFLNVAPLFFQQHNVACIWGETVKLNNVFCYPNGTTNTIYNGM